MYGRTQQFEKVLFVAHHARITKTDLDIKVFVEVSRLYTQGSLRPSYLHFVHENLFFGSEGRPRGSLWLVHISEFPLNACHLRSD